MIKIDENVANDWIYRIISLLDDPDKAKSELLQLSTYISRAPRSDDGSSLPKISVK